VTSLYPAQQGEVIEIPVREDETVKAGTVLLRVDDKMARFLLRQAEQDLKSAQLLHTEALKLPKQRELKIAQQQQAIAARKHAAAAARHALERKQKLEKNSQLAIEEVRAAEELVHEAEAAEKAEQEKLHELELLDPPTQIARAEADVAAKQITVDKAKYALEQCSLKAPVDGKVLRIFTSKGELLGGQPRQPAVQFCPSGPRIVRAELEQEFASRVAVGQFARVEDDSNTGLNWKGKVVRMSDWYTHRRSILLEPLQFNDVRTLECIVQLDPGQPPPRIGQRVRVMLGQR
jgi:multidrug resistance efflux pump